MLRSHGIMFEKNQLFFAKDTALVADFDKCELVSEFGRKCERSMLRENVCDQMYEVIAVCKCGSNRCGRV